MLLYMGGVCIHKKKSLFVANNAISINLNCVTNSMRREVALFSFTQNTLTFLLYYPRRNLQMEKWLFF